MKTVLALLALSLSLSAQTWTTGTPPVTVGDVANPITPGMTVTVDWGGSISCEDYDIKLDSVVVTYSYPLPGGGAGVGSIVCNPGQLRQNLGTGDWSFSVGVPGATEFPSGAYGASIEVTWKEECPSLGLVKYTTDSRTIKL